MEMFQKFLLPVLFIFTYTAIVYSQDQSGLQLSILENKFVHNSFSDRGDGLNLIFCGDRIY